jgi:hypothetical protein
VAKYCDFGDSNGDLLGINGSAGTEKVVEDAMDVGEVLPDEVSDLWVSGDGLVPSVLGFVVGRWAFDASVIHKQLCGVRDLGLKNKNYISVKYWHGTGLTLR